MSGEVVLVTGGAGYIGSHVCKALAAIGLRPVTYDNLSTGNAWAVKWGPLERGDILDGARLHEVFKAHRPIGVLHFAAQALVGESMRSPGSYYRNNTAGTLTLLDACRVHDVLAVVFSSTCAVYGAPESVPIAEDSPQRPINPYGASKLMAERMLDDYDMAYGLKSVALRYFNAAGADPDLEVGEAREVETHLVPLAIDALLGHRPPIQVLGSDYPTPDGTAVRDYIHVGDLAEAHVRALRYLLQGGASRKLNLGTGRGYSVREVLDAIEAVAGRPVPSSMAARRLGDPPVLIADPRAAIALLGRDMIIRSGLEQIISTAWAWHEQLETSGGVSPHGRFSVS